MEAAQEVAKVVPGRGDTPKPSSKVDSGRG